MKKARQAASNPNWIRAKLSLSKDARIIPILVTATALADKEAGIHLKEVAIWQIGQFRVWAANAVQTVRQLRVTFPGAGDLFWRRTAMEAYAKAGMDPASLVVRFTGEVGKMTLS